MSARRDTTERSTSTSKVKNSARLIGMHSSSFFSDPTEGLTRFCSISEIVPLVTPARFASSRWDRPFFLRMYCRRVATSMDIARFSDMGDDRARGLGQRVPASVEYSNHFNRCAAGENPERIPKYDLRNECSHCPGFQGHPRESPDKSF